MKFPLKILKLLTPVILTVPVLPQQRAEVVLEPRVGNAFIALYADKTLEFPLCVEGRHEGNTYYLEDVRIPFIYSTSDSSTNFNLETCYSDSYLGIAHAHPNDNPYPSWVDMSRFANDDRADLEVIIYNVKKGVNGMDSLRANTVIKSQVPDSLLRKLRR